ncbi:MAG: arginase [Flavobacteriia bacterium]|nr:arginase [Flavobacteriia bacterium]
MKDLSIFFKAREIEENFEDFQVGNKIVFHTQNNFPELKEWGIAIIECPEYRNHTESSINENPIDLLLPFYNLFCGDDWNFDIYDLGYILPGNTISDTYYALKTVCSECLKKNILPIVIGGSQDLSFSIYDAFRSNEQMVNMCFIDRELDLGLGEVEIKSNAFIRHIIEDSPCFLFNCSTIGVQSPYVKKNELDLFSQLYFDVLRLGELNDDFRSCEPLIRNSDMLSIDTNVLRLNEFESEKNSPNGLYAEQLCQIAKYAGMSDKLSCFSIFQSLDLHHLKNHQLLGEILWYFLDGIAQRKNDFPKCNKKDYLKFIVHLETLNEDIIFYKSPKSERWWMEVPYPMHKESKFERHYLVPCTEEDYHQTMKNDIPDLWWKTFQKLSI